MSITGPIFALATPFKRKDIDYIALGKYLDFLEKKGVKTILTNGTTGEFFSLTREERKELLSFCRKHFKGFIINHIGSTCLKDSLFLLEEGLESCDGVISLPPYYYSPVTSRGLELFFSELLERCPQPFYLYHFPRHTQIPLGEDVITSLKGKYNMLRGIKDSGGELEVSLKYKALGLEVYMGKESGVLEALDRGIDGHVSGAGNPVAEFLIKLYDCYNNNQGEKALEVQRAYEVWNRFRKSLPAREIGIVKAGLAARIEGFPLEVRYPLEEASKEGDLIKRTIREDLLPLLGSL
ncbi:MAG: dihydrodipicolinate synthase family protein [Candidatus Syntrophonatronum acetioxidans]|uniref:Dihydrodipicolinate synthase family protein n=1 Tax=Candidatus Syntrophonatronum acetioxidans TaxID=1795816 RepID=A0A424YEP8_9FIRM|nr:MAG: dihydrodipicolinate synthase family protein [Candidatus Syntrophonatronum acetioxidans]